MEFEIPETLANALLGVMATHDRSIVDRMQKRVIELSGGKLVRDERAAGYVTQAQPVQEDTF